MKLVNHTDFTPHLLRRMVSWCCREVGLPVRWLRRATFKNTKAAFSGLGGGRGIIVRIGPDAKYPVREFRRHGTLHTDFADRLEGLVGVTAHECYHCLQSKLGTMRTASHNEPAAQQAETAAVRAFRSMRAALLLQWAAEPQVADKAPAPSAVEQRAAKAAAALERWQRKLKLAQTKVRQYRRKVAYYANRADGSGV